MFMVFWVEAQGAVQAPQCKEFQSDDMAAALRHTEALRKIQRESGGISFVTLASENKQSVGLPGVADPAADYNWKKRRA